MVPFSPTLLMLLVFEFVAAFGLSGVEVLSRDGAAVSLPRSNGSNPPFEGGQIVPKGCATPQTRSSSRAFYVDPIHGDMKNDGSAAAPWRSLEEVVSAGLIATGNHSLEPGRERSQIVQGGDTIYLRSGDHGSTNLAGATNDDFITVEADKGHRPILKSLSLTGSSKWVFRGLTIQNVKTKLVELLNNERFGHTENVVLDRNELRSSADVEEWSQQDWIERGADTAIFDEASCSTITNNILHNIRRGIMLVGDDALVSGNVIDNFGDDAIDVVASRVSVRGNRITNSHDLGDGNHNDAIQGWTDEGKTNLDTTIDGNTIIASTNPALRFPGYLQGISVFDGVWENIRITNNVVITNAWHGIALYGPRRSTIINNTVLGTDPAITTWIGVFSMKPQFGGRPPSEVTVRNNVATRYNLSTSGIFADHNIVAIDPRSLFVMFDPKREKYDLHILSESRARGAGKPEQAPSSDIAGAPRVSPIDAGAYAWTQGKPGH